MAKEDSNSEIKYELKSKHEEEIKKAESARRELAAKAREFLESIKKKAEGFKKEAVSKYKKEIVGILLLPPKPQKTCPKCESENIKIDKQKGHCNACGETWNVLDMLLLMQTEGKPEEKFKRKEEIEKKLREIGHKKLPDVNITAILLDEIWDMCYKGKYDILNIISIGVPIYDSGWLGAIRATEMHKMMALKKFEKYIVCYVLAGSMVRGTATSESDIDTFVVVDDTDVTRMTSSELKTKLRGIILGMASEACMAAGIGNRLNVQVYTLTDMWESIKSANPVIFTFLRDGVPLYDRGMFMPWKLLLQHGKITPTPEAVDSYMKSGEQILDRVKYRLKDIAVEDFFWATITPSQGALMLVGIAPPDPKQTPEKLREHFVKKGLLEEKWVKILEGILQLRKDIEHGKIKEVSAKMVEEKFTDAEEYLKRLDKLIKQLESQEVKKELKEIYEKTMEDVLAALKLAGITASIETGLKLFEENLVKKKLAPTRYFNVIKRIQELNKKGEADRREIASLAFEQDRLAKDVFELIRAEKGKKPERFKISAGYAADKKADVWLLGDTAFIVMDTTRADTEIKKFKIEKDGSLSGEKSSNLNELNSILEKFAGSPTLLTDATLASFKKILAPNVKIVVGS